MATVERIWLGRVLNVAAVALAGLVGGWVFRHDQVEPDTGGHTPVSEQRGQAPRENRLAKESSPYLQLHKHNPIDWYPWGGEALERAKRENKPIFLSIGYSSCYWCHVMERESFNDPEIAGTLNKHFVCIKVDREELPDVDEVFMNFVLLSNDGRGGWPLTVFLTPDAKPVAGGTYFPPRDRDGLTGLVEALAKVLTAWNENRANFMQDGEHWAQELQRVGVPRSFTLQKLNRQIVSKALEELASQFDPEFGGFGYNARERRLAKFPQPCLLQLLAYQVRQAGDAKAEAMLRLTLDRMAHGGIWDHLGDGFHRYSVDRMWQVPHFEKMLYDNALLASVYLEAFELTRDPYYRHIATRIFEFVDRELTSPEGGFYSALDAESEHEEGKYYVWTKEQVQAALDPAEYELFSAVNGLRGPPNFDGKYVLQLSDSLQNIAQKIGLTRGDLAGVLERSAAKLLAVRQSRPRPLRDTKILTDWNALMITSLAEGYRVLGDDAYLARAERAANLILQRLRPDGGRLLHVLSADVARVPGYVDDYAFLSEAMLALYRATGQKQWLEQCQSLTDEMISLFWDESGGGFYRTGSDQEAVLTRLKSTRDSVTPSGSSVACRTMVSLAKETGSARYGEIAAATIRAAAGSLAQSPSNWPLLVRGLGEYLDAPLPAQNLAPRSPGPALQVVKAEVSPRRLRVSPGEDFAFAVLLDIDPEWHIYANPSSRQEYRPTVLELNSELPLADGKLEYPRPRAFQPQGVDESVAVYSGRSAIRFAGRLHPTAPAGQTTIKLLLRYQACSDQRCLTPQIIEMRLPIEVIPAKP